MQVSLLWIFLKGSFQLEATLPLSRHLAKSRDIFGCLKLGTGITGIWWAEARDVANHPTIHRTAPTSHPIQNANDIKVKKTCPDEIPFPILPYTSAQSFMASLIN